MHEPTEEYRSQVKTLAIAGTKQELIAKVLKISEPTLRKHYRDELDSSVIMANASVARNLFTKATGNGPAAVTAAIFWLKCRAGWKEPATDVHATVLNLPAPEGMTVQIFSEVAKQLSHEI